jgi:N-glycosidase YbiA
MESIDSFRGDYFFLSNFFPHPITIDKIEYPTVEHAFQAMKTSSIEEKRLIQNQDSPAGAKKAGRKVALREDWEQVKFEIMAELIRLKFADRELEKRLLATGSAELIEGNTWRDMTWGCVKNKNGEWKGRNMLGKILMEHRATCAAR